MAQGHGDPYCFDYKEGEDGSILFQCSTDVDRWPWLMLSPRHPLVIQTQNFWASFGAILFTQEMEEGQWSALTWTDWQCGDISAGHAVRGTYQQLKDGGKASYVATLFDAKGRKVVSMRGRGVIFRNRNFEKWRAGAKSHAQKEQISHQIFYASSAALGLSDGEFAFVAPLTPGSQTIEALVTSANGLPPHNRIISGSGDHVNSTHFGEVTRQALCLITGDNDVQVTGGEMELKRYIELGTPFTLSFEEPQEKAITFTLRQLGRECARIDLTWA